MRHGDNVHPSGLIWALYCTMAAAQDASQGTHYPKDVGILAMDIYFPSTYVSQEALELHDGVPQGECFSF